MAGAVFRGLVAVELQQVQRHFGQQLLQLGAGHVDEEPDAGHERRQRGDNRLGLGRRHGARTPGIEHQPDGVGPGGDCGQGVLDSGNAADFDANG
ncbi:hypothetical protein D9M68_623720 [compost metagenome]